MKNVAYSVKKTKKQVQNFRVIDINKKREKIKRIYRARFIFISVVSCLIGAFVMFIFNFLVGEVLIFQINLKLSSLSNEIKEIKSVNSNKEAMAICEKKDFFDKKNITEDKVEID